MSPTVICYDCDGTVSADPEFYRCEMRGLMEKGHDVHVLTGNPDASHLLAQMGLVKGRDFTNVVVVPEKNIAAVKVAYMRRVGASHLVDNRKANVKAARRAGFTAHWHMKPKRKK